MTVPGAKRLKDLGLENSRLTNLLAEAQLDIEALKVVARGKVYVYKNHGRFIRALSMAKIRVAAKRREQPEAPEVMPA